MLQIDRVPNLRHLVEPIDPAHLACLKVRTAGTYIGLLQHACRRWSGRKNTRPAPPRVERGPGAGLSSYPGTTRHLRSISQRTYTFTTWLRHLCPFMLLLSQVIDFSSLLFSSARRFVCRGGERKSMCGPICTNTRVRTNGCMARGVCWRIRLTILSGRVYC